MSSEATLNQIREELKAIRAEKRGLETSSRKVFG